MSEVLTNTGAKLWSKDDYSELWLQVFAELTGTSGKSNIRLIDEAIGELKNAMNEYYFLYENDRLYICKDENESVIKLPVSLIDSKGQVASSFDGTTITVDENGIVHGISIDEAFSETSTNPVQNKVVKAKFDEVDKALSEHSSALETLNGTGEGSVQNTVTTEIAKVVANAPEDLDTLKEISDWIEGHEDDAAAMNTAIKGKGDTLEYDADADTLSLKSGDTTLSTANIRNGMSVIVSEIQPTGQKAGDLWLVATEIVGEAGLYDANNVMLCSWEDSGINVSINYDSQSSAELSTSPYYVIENNYPTTTKIVIPKNVTTIGIGAFYDCSSLTSITIPSRVTSIGDHAFGCCSSLTSITIPSRVTSIQEGTFLSCSGLVSVTLSNQLQNIGREAFADCTSLASITIPSRVAEIGVEAFENCPSLQSVKFENPNYWSANDILITEDLSNPETAAACLTITYVDDILTANRGG